MKRIIVFLGAIFIAFSVLACGNDTTSVTTAVTTFEEGSLQQILQDSGDLSLSGLVTLAQAEANASDAGAFKFYGASSRISKGAVFFTERYGIEVECSNFSGDDTISKLVEEIGSVDDTADIALVMNAYKVQTELIDEELVVNFDPRFLNNTFEISDEDANPLVVYYGSKAWFYSNFDGTVECVDNIWALTEAAFADKVTIKDFDVEMTNANMLAMLTNEYWSGVLAAKYESYFGSAIVLDDDCANAGYQFIKNLLANNVWGTSEGTMSANLSSDDTEEGIYGFFAFSKWRSSSVIGANLGVVAYNDDNAGMEGFSAFLSPMYGQIVATTDRPYTSMLYIYFLMTEEGFTSSWQSKETEFGSYSANTTIASLDGDQPLSFWKNNSVIENTEYLKEVYSNSFYDWLSNLK